MIAYPIQIQSYQEIQAFVEAANTCPTSIDLVNGNYRVDAKSIMGIFGFPIRGSLHVEIEEPIEEAFLEKLKPFLLPEN